MSETSKNLNAPAENGGRRSQQRMVRRWVVIIIAIVSYGLGYWGGYWHGRAKEMYESGKRYGAIPSETTWSQWLERK